MKGITRVWILIAAALAACDEGMGPQVPELQVQDAVLAARGDTIRLSARGDGVVTEARWESLNPSVATVTRDGLVTAVAPGNVRVRASVAGAQAEGTVIVLPAVDIRLSELALVTDAGWHVGVRMRIRNVGGRGHYALELWKLDENGTKRRILRHLTETEAAPGLDVEHINYLATEAPDWVVAYSREPAA
ncbi:MAG: Ig-like domain-containing protein, partial [Longimicrobiales bacterium]|nr:Ig-like domain-containing protein [Longimicrobiales bacterium]